MEAAPALQSGEIIASNEQEASCATAGEAAWVSLVMLVPLAGINGSGVMLQYRIRIDRQADFSMLTAQMFMEHIDGEVFVFSRSAA